MTKRKDFSINYDETTGEHVDCSVYRGFPMGGIGSGGFSIGSDGRFKEFRINNNWMNPIRNVKGTFFAVRVESGGTANTRILRRKYPDGEYENIRPVKSTRFKGELPGFELSFNDELPLELKLKGFTAHIPHNIKDSTLPAALFTMRMTNRGEAPVSASVLFSWENILGMGGTGKTGVIKWGRAAVGVRGRLTYRDVTGNYQESLNNQGITSLAFKTTQSPDPQSHRFGTIGEYRVAVEVPENFRVTVCEGWNTLDERPLLLTEFSGKGAISSPENPVVGQEGCRPAAAICVKGEIPSGNTIEIHFPVVWWTPNHVTEKFPVKKARTGKHDGIRAGHIYENYFNGPDEIVAYVVNNRERLYRESFELGNLIDSSTLPSWLKRSIKNSIDSTLCNTIVPREGTLYTVEGMDWPWPYGGLTGTNDQRLSSHPYTSVFFTQLDMSEVDTFRKLMDARGSVPHGNGNCDMALGDASVPYGWPEAIWLILPAKEWADLTMSEIIQAGKLYRITGHKEWLKKFWPDLKKMARYMETITVNGVPEGGTTYDIWDFPGSFIYTATVYLAALKTMMDLAAEAEPVLIETYRTKYDECKKRIDSALWVEKGGYFRSTEKKDTVFTAALVGDWVSRYAGLGCVVEPKRAFRHMEMQYKVLIEAARTGAISKNRIPSPLAEAGPDGRPVLLRNLYNKMDMRNKYIEHPVYLWQVLSYQAMEHIYLGQVEKGLDVFKMIYDKINTMGFTWSACLMGEKDSVYMTHPVIWAAFNALTGAALDVPRGILHLAPQQLPGQETTSVPVCFPGFWAMLHFEKKTGRIVLEVMKHFGEPVIIKQVCLTDDKVVQLDAPAVLKTGSRIELQNSDSRI